MRRALPGPETSDYATLIRPTDYIEVTVLAAWCELRDDFRHFRADRIVACHETGDSFADLALRSCDETGMPDWDALSRARTADSAPASRPPASWNDR